MRPKAKAQSPRHQSQTAPIRGLDISSTAIKELV
jgi:hypothetical protein